MNDRFTRWLYEHNYTLLPGWPLLIQDEDIAEWYIDPLDVENLQVVAITDRGVEFCCGGDWQNPQRILLTPKLTIEVLDAALEQMPAWDTVVKGEWPTWLK